MESTLAEALPDLVQAVKDAAPHMWEAARRAVFAHIASNTFWGVVWGATVYGGVRMIRHGRRTRKHDDDVRALFIGGGWAITIVFSYVTAMCIHIATTRLIAFDWYTIKALADLVR